MALSTADFDELIEKTNARAKNMRGDEKRFQQAENRSPQPLFDGL